MDTQGKRLMKQHCHSPRKPSNTNIVLGLSSLARASMAHCFSWNPVNRVKRFAERQRPSSRRCGCSDTKVGSILPVRQPGGRTGTESRVRRQAMTRLLPTLQDALSHLRNLPLTQAIRASAFCCGVPVRLTDQEFAMNLVRDKQ